MSLTRWPGRGPWFPDWLPAIGTPAFSSAALIDATGEMAAFVGPVEWYTDDRSGTKSITDVYVRVGTVVKAGNSVLVGSLQDLDATTGPPMIPDGVQDQSVTVTSAETTLVTNGWVHFGPLSSNRTVGYGDKLAFVIEFDAGGRLGADAFTWNGWSIPNSLGSDDAGVLGKTGGVWGASTTSGPNIIFKFSDGTFGTLTYGTCYKAVNTVVFNSGSAADELALAFTVDRAMTIDALWAHVLISAGTANFDLVLYAGTTALATASVNAHNVVNAAARPFMRTIPEQTLSVGTQYYMAVKPTTTNNITAYSVDVDDVNYWTTQPGGTAFAYSSRVDAGAWAAITTTRRLLAGMRISKLDNGLTPRNPFAPSVIKAA